MIINTLTDAKNLIDRTFKVKEVEWTVVRVFHNFAVSVDYVELVRNFGEETKLGTIIPLSTFSDWMLEAIEVTNGR